MVLDYVEDEIETRMFMQGCWSDAEGIGYHT